MGWSRQLKLALSFSLVLLFLPVNAGFAHSHDEMLIPMGHSIGIKMDLSGVFVTNDVMLEKDLWLKAGDLIEEVNNVPVSKLKDFETDINSHSDK